MSQLEKLEQLAISLHCDVRNQEPMRKHTTFKIGGPADLFIVVNDVQALQSVYTAAKELGVPCMVIGKMCIRDRSMAVHSVSEFKRRVEGKQIVEYDNVDLSFTVLNKANNCNFAHVPYTADFEQFLRLFSEQKQKAENTLLPVGESTLACVYVTCVPRCV